MGSTHAWRPAVRIVALHRGQSARRRPSRIPAEGLMPSRLARLGQRGIQAPRRRCLAQGARGQARPVLQSALPIARRGRAVAAAAASVYRIDRPNAASSSCTNASAAAPTDWRVSARRRLNMVGPLGVGFTIDPAWKHVVVLGRGVGLATLAPISQLAAERHRRDRDPERAQPEFVMAGDLFARVGEVIERARHRRHQRGGERRGDPARLIAGAGRRVLHLRLQSPVAADEARRQGARHSRSGGHGAGHGLRARAPATSACAPSRSTAGRSFAACASKGRCSICRRRSDGRHEREGRERDAE